MNLTFEEGTERIEQFLNSVRQSPDPEFILENMLIPEFRNYYTPNIPYYPGKKNEGGNKIFIKNKSVKISRDSCPLINFNFKVEGFEYSPTHGSIQLIPTGTMSLREFMYVYANPEGYEILDKICFMIENFDWKEYLDGQFNPSNHSSMIDDDIPF